MPADHEAKGISMGYVPNAQHDVFISYAHNDDEADDAGDRWVRAFGRQLSVKLLKHLGEAASVWWDPELERAQLFDQVIKDTVSNSAVVLSLVSPSYEKSEYCQQELEWFAELGQVVTPAARSRALPVLLYNLPFERWPPLCHGTSGFAFYQSEIADLSRPLEPKSKAFAEQQWTLVAEIAAILNELKTIQSKSSPESDQPETTAESSFTVFLATSSDDLAGERAFLKKELQKEGIDVISKIPPPYDETAHAQATVEATTRADLCVHLLGNSAGTPIDEDNLEKTYPVEQARIALEHARDQLVLLPDSYSTNAIGDIQYEGFMDSINACQRQSERLRIVKDGRHQMLEEILNIRQQEIERLRAVTEPLDDMAATAFVDLHVEDLNHIGELVRYLGEKRIATVTMPSLGVTPKAGWNLFEQHLRNAQLFIVVYGTVGREWVHQRLVEGFKLITEKGLTTRIGIYVAPPDKPPEAINFGLCDVMLNTRVFDPATIEPLLLQHSVTNL